MPGAIVRLEATTFVARGPAAIAVLLVLLAVTYAGWSGDRWRDGRTAGIEEFEAIQLAQARAWRAELALVEQGSTEPLPFAANPMSISFPAVLPTGTLGDFAVGHTDLHPSSAEISPWNNLTTLFGRYQFENPKLLAVGSFDIALVVIVVMPLLMIAVSFDLLSRERARGTLALSLSAPVSLARILWTRLLVRNGVLWFAAVAAMFAVAWLNDVGSDSGDRFARFGLWLAASLIYGGFWLGLIALVVAWRRQATQCAAVLTALWFVLVFAIPGLVSTVTERVYPMPSRLAFLSDVRDVEAETNRNLASLTDSFLTDHPELTVGDEGLPSFYRAAFLANDAARRVTAPIVDGFERARSARSRTLDFAQYLSPAIVAQRLLHRLADADLERQYRFQAQARDALFELANVLGPAIVSRNRITLTEFDGLRRFTFVERTLNEMRPELLTPLVFLFAVGLALAALANRRLRDEEFWT